MSIDPRSVFHLSVAFDRKQVEAACTELSDAPLGAKGSGGIWQLDNGTLLISPQRLKSVLREVMRSYDLPDVDFGEVTKFSMRRGAVATGELLADALARGEAQSQAEVVFTGQFFVRRGGTLPHPTWRFLLTEGIPAGLRLRGEAGPNRCICSRDRGHEEAFVASPVLRVTRKAAQELLSIVSKDPEQLLEVEHRDLERITAKAAEDLGFDAELTAGSKDGGRDLVLRCRDVAGETKRIFAEVKHWTSGKRVGHRELRDLFTVVGRDGADGGVLISTSGFTTTAKQMAATRDVAELVRLIDLDEMITYVRESASPAIKAAPPASLLAEFVRKPLIS